ncbi:diguanylate cyclase/phosphodiesterase with PAS/PAC sensor(s) [Rhodoferax ferrireducens T118]|uniref:Diguanylate cyclase/phosphodiesterase with PAS/PAC sensor(S) n=1 Tax=Albidiferax ferrireducens (strain ATCC BAA-621 / DSM 15236 / T118) TaxID=338969 RepID=Q21ZG9_ALBFT|nr:diguanylate cyclase/phosphodiesterase with PAS/PAC sensor(s) [Rhodoferax ferrireducens T118]
MSAKFVNEDLNPQQTETDTALRQLNAQLTEKSRLLQTTLTSISQGILVFDVQGRVDIFNPRVCELLDLPERLLASRPTVQALTRYQRDRGDFGRDAALVEVHARNCVLGVAAGAPDDLPSHYLRVTPAGRTLEARTQALPEGCMVRTFTDVTDYVQAQATLQKNEERWKLALESTGDGVWDWHIQSGVEFYSKRLLEILGYDVGDVHLQARGEFDKLIHPDDMAQLLRARQAHFDGLTSTYADEHRVRCKDGSWKWMLSRGMVISRDAQGLPLRMIGTHTDVTERKKSEALIWRQAHFDTLTGLPNRHMLRDRVAQEIKKSKRDGLQLAVLFIDLDHFKEVNDTLGHNSGDRLLVEAARRISDCVRESDTVARMGGDEFAVILTELLDASSLERILQKILRALECVFQLDGEQAFVSASIGVTMYPLDAGDIEDLFKNADQALYVAKGAGRNRFSFFTPALQQAAQNRVRLANDLHAGLIGQQFRLVYQPIVELASGAVCKAEALIRWQHPTRGLISPVEFIPIAEASGLIVAIGEWVFQQAARQVQAWRTALDPDFQISVNKSPVQFYQRGKTKTPWAQQLQAMGLPGNSIVVEITEGLLLDTSSSVADQLLDLHDAGIQVSLDDFGTGYSSLSYLQRFDIDFVKIDQSFVRYLIPESTDLALCQAIIAMAHALGMKVIAEGVETAQQRDLLAAAGCDYGQGYLFSKPVSAPDFEAFMAAQASRTPELTA